MKYTIILLVFLPTLLFAQTKKERKQQQRLDAEAMLNITNHVKYLADDALEGRRTGTSGEDKALAYLIEQYKKYGLQPAGNNGTYQQVFEVNEGKQITKEGNALQINGTQLQPKIDYTPLCFSANATIQGNASLTLHEPNEPWLVDVKEILEDNKSNPHFDMMAKAYEMAKKAASKNAKAIVFYNSANLVDNILFNKNDTLPPLTIPVVYLNQASLRQHCKDATATYALQIQVNIVPQKRMGKNVVAYINNNATNTIILGAHYDHLGYGEDKNSLDGEGQIHNGADDNASGTAALLELARQLMVSASKQNNYLFISFSAEELGLLGSKYWLQHPTVQITPNYMINMDMVGRYDTAKKLTVGGYGTSPIWGETFKQVKTDLLLKWDSAGTGPSDHASFYRKDIPVLFFFTNSHSDYHKATDDWDKINYAGEVQIINLIKQTIQYTNDKGKLTFTKTREQQMGRGAGFTVSLGVIPDYGYTGTGVKIDGVSKGKTAEKIGLQANDVLLQLGEYKFVDVNSYMQALSKFKKGDQVKLTIKRGDKEISYDITF